MQPCATHENRISHGRHANHSMTMLPMMLGSGEQKTREPRVDCPPVVFTAARFHKKQALIERCDAAQFFALSCSKLLSSSWQRCGVKRSWIHQTSNEVPSWSRCRVEMLVACDGPVLAKNLYSLHHQSCRGLKRRRQETMISMTPAWTPQLA